MDKKEIIKSLMQSNSWPKAVNEELICDTPDQMTRRASLIVDTLIDQSLEGLKFLDFGGKEDYIAKAALQAGASLAVSTDNWDVAESQSPYDVILLYDVIDHVLEPSPLLRRLFDVELAAEGRIYMRCHPWVSRSATHLYKKFNKAYAHLFLSEDELKEMGGLPAMKSLAPMAAYSKIIKDSGLEVERMCCVRQDVDPFLLQEPMNSEFKKLFNTHRFPSYQMEQQFIDYILAKHAKKNEPFQELKNNFIQM